MIKELAEHLLNAAADADTPEDPGSHYEAVAPYVVSTLRELAKAGAFPEGHEVADEIEKEFE